MLVDLEVPDKKNPGKTITLKRYAVDSNVEPTAVLFGKWSPFTGPNGHGRIVDFAKKNGFKKVAIVSPERTKLDAKDKYDANIFNPKQRLDIVKRYAKEYVSGIEVTEIFSVPSTNPMGMFKIISQKIDRPVIFVGPDREKSFSKFYVPFDKDNKTITDTTDKDFGKGEMLVIKDRGSENTSGTDVRAAIVDNNLDDFIRMTGYKKSMFVYLRKLLSSNKIDITEGYKEFLQNIL